MSVICTHSRLMLFGTCWIFTAIFNQLMYLKSDKMYTKAITLLRFGPEQRHVSDIL